MATLFRKNEECKCLIVLLLSLIFALVKELKREEAKALETGAILHHGPVELQEEENYVMCKEE